MSAGGAWLAWVVCFLLDDAAAGFMVWMNKEAPAFDDLFLLYNSFCLSYIYLTHVTFVLFFPVHSEHKCCLVFRFYVSFCHALGR